MAKINVALCGFGQVGRFIYNHLKKQPDMKVVAVIDHAPEIAGKDAGMLAAGEHDGMIVGSSVKALDGLTPDVAIAATVSSIETIAPLMRELISRKISVITTCEEMFFPLDPIRAAEVDQLARQHGVAVAAGGINPGFLMDYMPVAVSGMADRVEKIEVFRVQNAAVRRMQFQKKIGAGLDLESFEKLKQSGVLRHVGLAESIHFIANALDWHLDEVTESISPLIAECDYNISGALPVAKGEVRGVRQLGVGRSKGRALIRLDFVAAIGEPESYDKIHIEGEPSIESTIRGGVNGDVGSCGVIINLVRRLAHCDYCCGLVNLLEIPMLRGRGI